MGNYATHSLTAEPKTGYFSAMPLPLEVEVPLAAAEFMMAAVGFAFQIRDQRKRRPCYRRHSIKIVAKPLVDFDDLKITYQGQSIEDLTLTEFFFWNDGSRTFHEQDLDVGAGEHLRIATKGSGKIFQCPRLIADPKNGVEMLLTEQAPTINHIQVKFKFLDSGQGWAMTLKHSGEVELLGSFRDANSLKLKERPSGIAVLISAFASVIFLLTEHVYIAGATFIVLIYTFYAQVKNPAPAKFRRFLDRENLSLPFP